MIREQAYILTDDDILFYVSCSCRSGEEILGMPFYFPTLDLQKALRRHIRPSIQMQGRDYSKILSEISYLEYIPFIRKHYPEYFYSPAMWKVLMRVHRSKIRKIVDPIEFVQETLRSGEDGTVMRHVLTQLIQEGRGLTTSIGITGSTLLSADTQARRGDIDIVVYGSENVRATRQLLGHLCEFDPRFSRMDSTRLESFVRSKAHLYPGSYRDLYNLKKRSWDQIFIDDTRLDFRFANYDDDRCSYDDESMGVVDICAKVIDTSGSCAIPSTVRIDSDELSRVIITSREYNCLLEVDDIVKIRGSLHYSEQFREKLLVVDSVTGGCISLGE
jgi:predicted nucleotidyltransferase